MAGAERVELWGWSSRLYEITHARARRRENDGVCVESRERNTALSTCATNGPCSPSCWWPKKDEWKG